MQFDVLLLPSLQIISNSETSIQEITACYVFRYILKLHVLSLYSYLSAKGTKGLGKILKLKRVTPSLYCRLCACDKFFIDIYKKHCENC